MYLLLHTFSDIPCKASEAKKIALSCLAQHEPNCTADCCSRARRAEFLLQLTHPRVVKLLRKRLIEQKVTGDRKDFGAKYTRLTNEAG